jgi:peptide/nickel transport system substrate-binding protein
LCVALALTAAACGSDKKETSSTTAAPTTAAGATTTAAGATTTAGGTETTAGGTETTAGGTETTAGGTETTAGGSDTTTGGSDTTTGGSTGNTIAEPETELDSSSAQDINPQPRDALKQGGEIRLAVDSLAENWNPNNVNGNDNTYTQMREPMEADITQSDAEGTVTPNPLYLSDLKVEDGPPQKVTYNINPKAVWGDGSPIVANDFIQYWKALTNPDNEVVSTDGYDQIDSVVQGKDEREVVVTFKSVYPDYLGLFSPLVPAAAYADTETFNNGWTTINPAWFAGPYTLESVDTAQGIVTEVPNPKWWGDPPLLDKIIFRVVSVDAVPQAYANGEIDAFDIGPDPNGYAIASGTSSGEIRAAAGPNWRQITFNTTAGFVADQTVRQAIVLGLDRAQIGSSDLAGIPWPAKPLGNHVFVENQKGYVDNGAEWNYDPEKAKSLLEGDGWALGSDGYYAKDGKTLEVKFSQLTGVPVSQNEAQLVQAQLKDIGIKVTLVDVSTDKFSQVLADGDFELIAFTWIGTPFPFPGIKQLYGTGSDSNYARSNLPEVDKLTDEIAVTIDVAKRTELANQVDKILWDFVHTLPLYQRPELYAVNSNIANYGAFGFASRSNIWPDVGFMK